MAAYLASTTQEAPHLSFRDRVEQAPGSDTIRLLEVAVRTQDGRFASSLDARDAIHDRDYVRDPKKDLRIFVSDAGCCPTMGPWCSHPMTWTPESMTWTAFQGST